MAGLSVFGALSIYNRPRLESLSPVAGSERGWWTIFSGTSGQPETNFQRDIHWSHDEIVASPALWTVITLIAGDIAKLKPRVLQLMEWGGWALAENASAFSSTLRRPNRYQNSIQFIENWILSKLQHGNTYVLKERDQRGVVARLYVLNPEWVTVLVDEEGGVWYQLSRDPLSGFAEDVIVPASEIIHDRFNCLFHPLVGISPIFAAALPALQALRNSKHWTKFFGNNAQPGGILSAPGSISPDVATRIKNTWDTNYTGINAGRVAVLGDNLTYSPLSPTALDTQVVEQLKWTGEIIAATFHVPAYKLNIGTPPAVSGAQLDTEYYKQCLQRLIEDFEACMDEGLGLDTPVGSPARQLGIELDLSGLLRMDEKSQIETLKAGVDASIFAINDARGRLNLKPLTGGDTVYMQQQDFPLDQVKDNVLPSNAAAVPAQGPALPPPPPPEPGPDPEAEEARAALLREKAKQAADVGIAAAADAARVLVLHRITPSRKAANV